MTTRTASELFAQSMSRKCEGCESCHWCGSPCTRQWIHDDPPLLPGQKRSQYAARPGNAWVCLGCWNYKRPRVTVQFLTGGLKDGQTLANHSWLLTEEHIRGIRIEDYDSLYQFLLAPVNVFALSLIDDKESNVRNQIQLAKVNDVHEIKGDTQFQYTVNNRVYTYSPYELEEALKYGEGGVSGGVLTMIRLLGDYKRIERRSRDEKLEVGRPKKEERDRLPGKKINGGSK